MNYTNCFKLFNLDNNVKFVACDFTADVQIQKALENLRHVEKETATLSCKVKNPQKYPVTWYKDSEEITPDGAK